ncbi:hypothetical protein [Virgibacillus sp. JSM 102003]|uniref:hypothetical protein n=1 Tax=Virgibacillus sp. JSM 102003 TaxID=1562108 RepID=UPI0035BF7A11
MFRCAWCMKKIADDQPLHALNVKFADGIDYSDQEGEIVQVYLTSRGTSVPMIVATADSEAKENGGDGLFALCSETCSEKMQTTLAKEINTFNSFSTAD